MPLTIVPREAWRPIPVHPEDNEEMVLPAVSVVLQLRTCTEPCYTMEECLRTVRDQQKISRAALGLHDIQYNFMLGGDGRVYEGRGWTVAPPYLPRWWHLPRNRYLYIGSIGDFKDTHLSEEIWYSAWELFEFGVKNNYVKHKASFKYDSFTKLEESESEEEDLTPWSSEEDSGYFCSDYVE